MKYITSPGNATVKKTISLKRKKYRSKEKLYLIEGINICLEALKDIENIDSLLVSRSIYENPKDSEQKEIISKIYDKKVRTLLIDDALFEKISATETSQGVLAIMNIKEWDENNFFREGNIDKKGSFLVLDRIQDPGNAGTLVRTSEAAGYLGVVIVKGSVDIYNPKAVRSAAGSILRHPLFFTGDAKETIDLLKRYDKKIVVPTPYSEDNYFQLDFGKDIALVIGNEAGGADDEFLKIADHKVKIPMEGFVESLNAAVAGGILMYESVRRDLPEQKGGI
jgi:TrmH family RNA methyltransferase